MDPEQADCGAAAQADVLGEWLVASDGGVFSFGDAQFYRSTGNPTLAKPVVSAMATTDGLGYYLVAADGGVYNYDSTFFGSMGGITLAKPVVGISGT